VVHRYQPYVIAAAIVLIGGYLLAHHLLRRDTPSAAGEAD
jgi:hypothetical protein